MAHLQQKSARYENADGRVWGKCHPWETAGKRDSFAPLEKTTKPQPNKKNKMHSRESSAVSELVVADGKRKDETRKAKLMCSR